MSGSKDTTPRVRHTASLESDPLDSARGTWRCSCGFTRPVDSDRAAAERDVEDHVRGVTHKEALLAALGA